MVCASALNSVLQNDLSSIRTIHSSYPVCAASFLVHTQSAMRVMLGR